MNISYKVVFLNHAVIDLHEIKSYLVKHFSVAIWKKSYAKIKKSIGLIKKAPQIGLIPPELENLHSPQFRQVISGQNRIIYEIRREMIYIHLICDTRKELQALLSRRLLRDI
jgi:plasmid stabilization system protein ParE